MLAILQLLADEEEDHHPSLAALNLMAGVAQGGRLQQRMALIRSERLADRLKIGASPRIVLTRAQVDHAGDEGAVAMDLLMGQAGSVLIAHDECPIDEQVLRVADRLLVVALTRKGGDTRQPLGVEPLERAWQIPDGHVVVGVGEGEAAPRLARGEVRLRLVDDRVALGRRDERLVRDPDQRQRGGVGVGRRLQEGAGGAQAGRLGWHVVGSGCGVYLWQRGDASVAEPRRIHHVLRVCGRVPPEVEPGLFDKLVAGRAGGDGGGG